MKQQEQLAKEQEEKRRQEQELLRKQQQEEGDCKIKKDFGNKKRKKRMRDNCKNKDGWN